MRIEGTEKITSFPENLVARSHMVTPWKGGNVLLLRDHLSRTLTFLRPLVFGPEPTEELVHVRLPVIMKEIEVNKEMPGRDSAVKCFVIDPLFK